MPMLPVPVPILKRFDAILEKRAVAPIQRADYKKWLRYFLDFCTKYPVPEARPDQVRLFIDKLREKRQTPVQQKQAAHAVSLYFEMQRKGETPVADFNTSTTTLIHPGTSTGPGKVSLFTPVHSTKDHFICCAGTASALASVGRRLCR